jgi:hypothetical protein
MITVNQQARAELNKRLKNIKYGTMEKAQYQAMQSVLKPIRERTKAEWASQVWKRNGKRSIRKAIIQSVKSLIFRRGGKLLGYVGISQKVNRKSKIVNVLNTNFLARNGKIVPGRFIREKVFELAQKQASNFEAYLQRAALRMANGK